MNIPNASLHLSCQLDEYSGETSIADAMDSMATFGYMCEAADMEYAIRLEWDGLSFSMTRERIYTDSANAIRERDEFLAAVMSRIGHYLGKPSN